MIFLAMFCASFVIARQDDMVHKVITQRNMQRTAASPKPSQKRVDSPERFTRVLPNGVVVVRTTRAGVLEGNTTYTFPHSEVIEKTESYLQGNLVKTLINYPSGTPMHEVQIVNPDKQTVSYWYENGFPRSSETYFKGKLLSGEYFDMDHNVEDQVDKGKGLRVKRDAYGQLIARETIDKGEVVLRTEFHPNGYPRAIIPFKNGKIEGKKKTFLPAGEPVSVETWEEGQQHGETMLFKNGEKSAEVPYSHGKKEGVEKRYRDGKTVVEEVYWSDDKRHGPSFSYVDKIVKAKWFYRGKLVKQSQYDKYLDVPYKEITSRAKSAEGIRPHLERSDKRGARKKRSPAALMYALQQV